MMSFVSPSTTASPSIADYGISPDSPLHLQVIGELITLRLPRARTGGALSVIEVQTPVGGGVPFLHAHPGAETFIVLDGTFEIYGQVEGKKTVTHATVDTVVYVPSQAPHGYANIGNTPGRLLLILHGENQMEEFFQTIGVPVTDPANPPVEAGPPDVEAFSAAMSTYGLTFIEPPPF